MPNEHNHIAFVSTECISSSLLIEVLEQALGRPILSYGLKEDPAAESVYQHFVAIVIVLPADLPVPDAMIVSKKWCKTHPSAPIILVTGEMNTDYPIEEFPNMARFDIHRECEKDLRILRSLTFYIRSRLT